MTQKLSYIYWSKRSSGDGHDPDAERTQQVRLAGAGAGAAGDAVVVSVAVVHGVVVRCLLLFPSWAPRAHSPLLPFTFTDATIAAIARSR